jgi:hypothetical protein
MAEEKLITRRGIFIVSYQLDGICNALRLIVQTGAPVGSPVRAIVAKLRADFARLLASGRALDSLPEVSDDMSAPELLALAETLRSSALCFLTPDETDERKRAMGFNQEGAE